MKKLLSLLLCCIVSMTLLAACSASDVGQLLYGGKNPPAHSECKDPNCTICNSDEPLIAPPAATYEGVTMQAEHMTYPEGIQSITVIWINDTDNGDLIFGESFHLEKLTNGAWAKMPIDDDVGFNLIAYMLNAHSTREHTYHIGYLSKEAGNLKSGSYRIAAHFLGKGTLNADGSVSYENSTYWMYAEFTVKTDLPLVTPPEAPVPYTNVSHAAYFIRSDTYNDFNFSAKERISNRQQLYSLHSLVVNDFMENEQERDPRWKLLSNYPASYFENGGELLIFNFETGSGSYRHKILNVWLKGDTLSVNVGRFLAGAEEGVDYAVTGDMASWTLVLEVGNLSEDVKVEFNVEWMWIYNEVSFSAVQNTIDYEPWYLSIDPWGEGDAFGRVLIKQFEDRIELAGSMYMSSGMITGWIRGLKFDKTKNQFTVEVGTFVPGVQPEDEDVLVTCDIGYWGFVIAIDSSYWPINAQTTAVIGW